MPDTRVEIPGVGAVDFPESMSPDEISAAAKRLHDQAQPKPPSLARQLGRAAVDTLPGVGALVGGVLSTPETFGAGTVPGMALGAAAGKGARDLIAEYTGLDEPTSPMDKAGAIAQEGVFTAATAAVMPGVAAAVRHPIQTLREGAKTLGPALPPSVRRIGRMFPALPKSAPEPILQRPGWQRMSAPEPAPAPNPATTRTGTAFQPSGPIPSGPVLWTSRVSGQAAPAAPAASQAMSAAEKAALAKQGYSADVIAKIERAAGRQAAPAPVAAPAAAPPPVVENPALKPPRVQIGAERVGRQAGLSKEEVRKVTGPVLDETAGDASPVFPKQVLKRIVNDLKALPKDGPEREAYVARATSGKTKAQVETVRRTLEELGLIVPVAAALPTLRGELERMMSSRSGS